MIQIDGVEIRYFRSIYRTRFKNLTDVVVLAGRNDIGKSNILKALNLFFNNQTDWNTPFEFTRDFSRRRLAEVRLETIKGRQYIEVIVQFVRGNRFEKSLPSRFTVTRTWYRDSQQPQQRNSLQTAYKAGRTPGLNPDRMNASLQRYLNTVRFEYVPAIKDSLFFSYVLGRLQDVILGKQSGESGIADAITQLNSMVKMEAKELHEEFSRTTGISTEITLPKELSELFRALAVATKIGKEDMPLNLRGDGIRSRFLPSLLHYVSEHSKLNYIWGFEEPENSLEHALATKLAAEVVGSYSQGAQIFITSHSPAFFSIKDEKVAVYRILREDDTTIAQCIRGKQVGRDRALSGNVQDILEEEMGLMEFQEQYQRQYEVKVSELEIQRQEIERIRQDLDEARSPVLLTEGKWDAVILTEAWKKLNPDRDCPFRILSCDPMAQHTGTNGGGAGGVSTLKAYLETARADHPVTVGLFDRDKEGLRNGFFKLNSNFMNMSGQVDVKVQKIGTTAAMVLPVIPGREQYANADNLVLEFYFEEEFLAKRVRDKGLVLFFPDSIRLIPNTGLRLPAAPVNEPYLRQIVAGSKKAFAELVVPTFPERAFAHFAHVFELTKKAVAELRKIRAV